MAKVKLSQWVYMRVSVAIVTLLPICITVLKHRELEQREKRDILASTEIPVEYIDPASIDLTPLVNTLINATHTGSLHLFSVLSVTSHSSLALHKLTLLVYNISNFQDIESSLFPTRYCYCVTNKTNDLTDFTAILLDVMGNSTSYLQELFKSSSILSVSQRNSSECIYICVMAGKTDRDLSKLWDSVPPLFNHTIIEDTHKANTSYPEFPFGSTKPAVSIETHPTEVRTTTTSAAVSVATVPTAVIMTTSPATVSTPTHPTALPLTTPAAVTIATAPTAVTMTSTTATVSMATHLTSGTMISPPATVSMTTQPTDVTMMTTPSKASERPAVALRMTPTSSHMGSFTTITTEPSTTETRKSTTVSMSTVPSSVSLTTSDDIPITTQLRLITLPTSLTTTITRTAVPMATEQATMKMYSAVTRQPPHTLASMTTTSSGATSHTVIKTPATIANATPPTTATTITNPAIFKILTTDTAGCPWRAELFYQGNQREDLIGNRPTVSTLKLLPCVFELCKFFSQCLCRGYSHKTFLQSYCTESHVWYEKHTVEVCSRVRRVAFSRNLKQKCLSRMCV